MRKLMGVCVMTGAMVVAGAALFAQGPPPGGPGGAAGGPGGRQGGGPGPAAPTNLKVLPKTWTRQQVGAVMQTFTESLGVQCAYCHAEDPNAPPPAAGRGPALDYALDTKKEKDIARDMIKMVMSANDGTKALSDGTVAEKVSCFTCHRGEKKPATAPAAGWGRGSFTLSTAGPVVPQRGAGGPGGAGAPGAPGGPGAPAPGGAPAGGR
jgi:hypothetical protein